MPKKINVAEHIEAVRKETLEVLDRLTSSAQAYQLSAPPAALEEYRGKLVENRYNVLVVGEMKHGKSSLINAVIGRDILPTDVDVATSVVFRVRSMPTEAYRIRFEDESTKDIALADLPRYGSQHVIDEQGVPKLSQLPRWIEVDVPTAFLPANVNLLDTPGLGSLYADHALVTLRFIPQSDAVIFVLDSEKPMIKPELDYIAHILSYTPNIFFIQTKIDQYDDAQWQLILRRNQEILEAQFRDKLLDTTIWPLSSTNLMMAAQTGDPDLLEYSYFKQLARELQAFLFRVSGINRCTNALAVAEHYQQTAQAMLVGNIERLQKDSTQQLATQQATVSFRKQQFADDWSQQGTKKQEVLTRVRKIADVYKRSFTAFLSEEGKLDITYRNRVSTLQNMNDVRQMIKDNLGVQVTEEVTKVWSDMSTQAREQSTGLLAACIEASNVLLGLQNVSLPSLDDILRLTGEMQGDRWDKFDKAQSNFFQAWGASQNALHVAFFMLPAAVIPFPVVTVPAIIVVSLLAAIRGYRLAEKAQFKEAQQQLNEYLTAIFKAVRERFLQPHPIYEGDSLVNHYFDTLVQTVEQQLDEFVQKKLQDAQLMNKQLEEAQRMNTLQRQNSAERLQEQLTEWQHIGATIQAIVADLKMMESSLESTP